MKRTVTTRAGIALPAVGQGTWRMGEKSAARAAEVRALQLGLDLGLSLIDTAEMYADAESVVGDAIRGRRDEVFLVSKVLPGNASRRGTIEAAERSLRKLGTDRIDLYLLHWPGSHPLEATYAAFEELGQAGKILAYGVSNFDLAAMEASESTPGGEAVVANQLYYNLERRGIERRLLPWCAEREIAVMAYTPVEPALGASRRALSAVARRHGASPAQIAVAWTLRHRHVVSIPKAVTETHVRENAACLDLVLDERDLDELERAFPAPDRDIPLEIA